MAAVPRSAVESALVDGASPGQILRRITIPLLYPTLLVVLLTLVINILKIFDLVYVLAPDSSQASATVLSVEIYRTSFGGPGGQSVSSALGVLLFLLVIPAMLFNIRRLRRHS
jgi:alpha-glucoside transport system permease protein